MAETVTLRLDMGNFTRAVDRLKTKAPVAIVRSLNRAAVSAQTAMQRAMAQDTGLPVGTVKKAMSIFEARPDRLVSQVEARGARIPLMDFRARGPEPSRGRGRGVTARLPGGAGRYPHLFIATTSSGHRGVFGRVPGKFMHRDPKRQAIQEKFGPSLVHVFTKHRAAGLEAGEASLIKNLQHEFRWALQEAAAGGS